MTPQYEVVWEMPNHNDPGPHRGVIGHTMEMANELGRWIVSNWKSIGHECTFEVLPFAFTEGWTGNRALWECYDYATEECTGVYGRSRSIALACSGFPGHNSSTIDYRWYKEPGSL